MSESAEPSNQPDNKAPEGNRKLPVDGNVAGRLSMVASLAPGAIAIAEPDGRFGEPGAIARITAAQAFDVVAAVLASQSAAKT